MGRPVFITGAASGIARAVALQIARQGCPVGVCDRQSDEAAHTVAAIRAAGGRATSAVADVCELSQLQSAFGQLEQELGTPAVVLACAGITAATLLDELNPDRDERVLQINLLGVARTLAVALPLLRRSGDGHFAGVSSLVALRGLPFTAAYCGSKSAIGTYLETVRPWMQAEKLGLTVVYPGYVRTPLTEAGAVKPPIRMLEPEQAAAYIVRALGTRQERCAFPRGLAWGISLLKWLPPKAYDRLMTKATKRISHLKY